MNQTIIRSRIADSLADIILNNARPLTRRDHNGLARIPVRKTADGELEIVTDPDAKEIAFDLPGFITG